MPYPNIELVIHTLSVLGNLHHKAENEHQKSSILLFGWAIRNAVKKGAVYSTPRTLDELGRNLNADSWSKFRKQCGTNSKAIFNYKDSEAENNIIFLINHTENDGSFADFMVVLSKVDGTIIGTVFKTRGGGDVYGFPFYEFVSDGVKAREGFDGKGYSRDQAKIGLTLIQSVLCYLDFHFENDHPHGENGEDLKSSPMFDLDFMEGTGWVKDAATVAAF